jgi:hypothetical protein
MSGQNHRPNRIRLLIPSLRRFSFERAHTHVDFAGKHFHSVKFEVITATSMKMAVFWDMAPCSVVLFHRSSPTPSSSP